VLYVHRDGVGRRGYLGRMRFNPKTHNIGHLKEVIRATYGPGSYWLRTQSKTGSGYGPGSAMLDLDDPTLGEVVDRFGVGGDRHAVQPVGRAARLVRQVDDDLGCFVQVNQRARLGEEPSSVSTVGTVAWLYMGLVQGSAHVHGLVQTPQRHVMGGSHRIHVACGKRSENGD